MAETAAVGTNPTFPEATEALLPTPIADDQNPAIQDALKVYRLTVAFAVAFVAAAGVVLLLARFA